MPIIGITGGIASGKSSFRKLLLERVSATFFDSDACARLLLEEDADIRAKVREQVHPDAYDANQQPNREILRETIYRDPAKKAALESILHPVIRGRWSKEGREVSAQGSIFIVDIPLLFETKAETFFDHIVTVACTIENQLARLLKYRNLNQEMAGKIIATQFPLSRKISKSHHVVWNNGSHEALVAQTEIFSKYLNARYG